LTALRSRKKQRLFVFFVVTIGLCARHSPDLALVTFPPNLAPNDPAVPSAPPVESAHPASIALFGGG
jgi:hypothetical protein